MIKPKKDFLMITSADYLSDYKLEITFNNKTKKKVDLSNFLKKATNPSTIKYRNKRNFKNFRIEHGDLLWGDYEMIFPINDLYEGKID